MWENWVSVLGCSWRSWLGLEGPFINRFGGNAEKNEPLAGLSKYWDSELTHTAVRSLTGELQPGQSSVGLLSWYAMLLWVTETSTATPTLNEE